MRSEVQQIKKRYPSSTFEFHSCNDQQAIERTDRGEAHLSIVSMDVTGSLHTKSLEQTKFQTYVGPGHKLFESAKQKRTVSIDELLKFAFVSPNNPLLGAVRPKQSLDGWRDDTFARRVGYVTSSLKMLEEFVVNGMAVAYLPTYFAEHLDIEALKVSGCPYSCEQKIKLVMRNPKEVGWLNQIF